MTSCSRFLSVFQTYQNVTQILKSITRFEFLVRSQSGTNLSLLMLIGQEIVLTLYHKFKKV
jgi:hypothetical protein